MGMSRMHTVVKRAPNGGKSVQRDQAGPSGRANTAENFAAGRYVSALRGPNNKYINTTYNLISQTPVLSAPVVLCLNAVVLGLTENNRIGRLCKMKWLDLDLQITAAGVSQAPAFRIYIVVETTTLGSLLSPASFFADNVNFNVTSQRDRTNRNASRYLVLYDSKTQVVASGAAASGVAAPVTQGVSAIERDYNIHLDLGFVTDYSRGTAGTVADIDTNALQLVIVTDNTVGGDLNIIGGYTLCFNDDS